MNKITFTSILILILFLANISSSQFSDEEYISLDGQVRVLGFDKAVQRDLKLGNVSNNFPAKTTSSGIIEYSPTGIHSFWDFQSYSTPQFIWQDPNNPSNVHAVYRYSPDPSFAERYTVYFFSSNSGMNWINRGNVPPNEVSGYPSIDGFDNGNAIIGINLTVNDFTKIKLYIDSAAGAGRFSELDPPDNNGVLWSKVLGIRNEKIVFAGCQNGSISGFTNTATNIQPPGTFSGYDKFLTQLNRYALSKSPSGKIGFVYGGELNDINTRFRIFYKSSTDDGLTWSPSEVVWEYNETDEIGIFRGMSLVFMNETPVCAFETCQRSFPNVFFPEEPSQIRVWSPAINGGIAVIAADSSIVPFYPNKGNPAEEFVPICRPSIGKSTDGKLLILTFSATTGIYASADSNSYYSTWIAFSSDGGATWFNHEKITPDTPLRDWRFVSISQTNNVSSNQLTAQIVSQSDSAAGIYFFNAPVGDAELVGIRYTTDLNSGIPVSPKLISPSHNSSASSLQPVINWSDVPDATSYRINIALNSDFSNLIFDQQNITSSEIMVPAGLLNINTNYYWRVNASNANGSSIWTPVRIFNTNVTGVSQLSSEIPGNFRLSNNYPNPFNPVTKIEFDIPSYSQQSFNVKLIVYDALGKEVSTLVNQSLLPGSYSVNFNGANLQSGVYFCILNAGNFRDVRKMMLVK